MPKDLLVRLDWTAVYPPFRDKCFELAARCRARGVDYFATSGYRSPEEQIALWQKGRNAAGAVVEPKQVVTKVKFSVHNVAAAVDWTLDADLTKKGLQPDWLDAEKYRVLAEEAQKLGLEAGFFWKSFRDPPHVQLPLSKHGITLTKLRHVHMVGGVERVWEFLDKYEW